MHTYIALFPGPASKNQKDSSSFRPGPGKEAGTYIRPHKTSTVTVTAHVRRGLIIGFVNIRLWSIWALSYLCIVLPCIVFYFKFDSFPIALCISVSCL